MLKILLFVAAAFATVQCFRLNEILNQNPVTKSGLSERRGRLATSSDEFSARTDWSYFHPSWSLPSMPSMSYFFKDDEDDDKDEKPTSILSKKLTALEKWVKELNDLVKKQANGFKKLEITTTTPKNEMQVPPCATYSPKATMEKKPEKDEKPSEPTGEKKADVVNKKSPEPGKDEETPGKAEKPSEDSRKVEGVDKTEKKPVEDTKPETPKEEISPGVATPAAASADESTPSAVI